MIYLCNTLSLHMLPYLPCGKGKRVEIKRVSMKEASYMLQNNAFRSFFGHKKSVRHLSKYLQVSIPVCRGTIELREGDVLLVAAIQSKREWEQGLKGCPTWRFYTVQVVR